LGALDSIIAQIVPQTKNLVGIDIGAGFIKVCEISGSRIERFHAIPLSEAAIIEDEIQKEEEVISKVQRCIEEAGIKAFNVSMSLQGPNTVLKRMQVPAGNEDEVEDHILWESEQYIPFGADNSVIHHAILGDNEGGGKDVILVAAREDTVLSFEKIVADAGYKPRVIELSTISFSNLFEVAYADKLKKLGSGVALIDFGAQSTKICIYKAGGPVFSKEIPVGGVLVTEEIQRQMGVSYSEAEDLKINGDANGRLPEEIMGIIEEHLNILFEDVKKSLNFFLSGGTDSALNACLITGGNSRLPGLAEQLEDILDIEVQFFDPLRRLKPPSGFSNEEKEMMSAIGCIAMGLALRKMN
jgi:type IV pilus assembly protein PilM